MRRLVCLVSLAWSLVACNGGEDPPPRRDTGPTPMMWLVGTEGTMLRSAGDEISGYPLSLESDLRAIVCRGLMHAFAVGDGGVLLTTFDGGIEWSREDFGPEVDLASVAAAHRDVVWLVGDGAAFFSADSGANWQAVEGVEEDLTAVATTDDGLVAFAAARSGAILRFELRRGFEPVRAADGRALLGISASPLGESIIAVGEGGIATRSDDWGYRFSDVASDTGDNLRAVRLRSDGAAAIAVGDGGVVVRWGDATHPEVDYAPTLGRSLAALHASASGSVVAVGDEGVGVESWDFGATFVTKELGVSVDLTGIDDLHVGKHY